MFLLFTGEGGEGGEDGSPENSDKLEGDDISGSMSPSPAASPTPIQDEELRQTPVRSIETPAAIEHDVTPTSPASPDATEQPVVPNHLSER